MVPRLMILAGFASAIILFGFALQMALQPELHPLPKQDRDAIAELGETVAQRVKEQDARRRARLRGEPVKDRAAEQVSRDEMIAMAARSAGERREIEQIVLQLEQKSKDGTAPMAGFAASGMPEIDTVRKLSAVVYATEVHRLLKFDANHDGVLDRAELEKSAGRKIGPVESPFPSPDEVLQADLNGDGLLTREELLEAYEDPFAGLTQVP